MCYSMVKTNAERGENMFGFTNDAAEYRRVIDFREAAKLDGWEHRATYKNESAKRVTTLVRDGYKIHAMSRTNVGKWKYEAQICIWGPDGCAIKPPSVYGWDAITSNYLRCHFCGEVSELHQVGFANKACASCLPAAKKKLEYPGWCN